MRSFLAVIALLVCFLASTSALKGVRGSSKQFRPAVRNLQEEVKEKKCKKFKEPKAVKESVADPKAAKETVADPKAIKETVADPKATKETVGDPKATKETVGDPKATSQSVADPKAAKETVGDPKAAKDSKDLKAVDEDECLEWDRADDVGDSTIMTGGAMGSTGTSTDFQSVNVDCDAIANDAGPTDVHSVSFSVNMDLLKDADTGLNSIYSAMEKELQTKVAPRIAGCSGSRMLAEESATSKIVHVDFGEFEMDNRGCDSSLAKEAAEVEGICSSSDIPVVVYYVGDFPSSAMAKVEVAIEEHEWDIDGLVDTSEVEIMQTGSSTGEGSSGPPVAVFAGVGVAALAALAVGFFCYKRSRNSAPVAKAELDTDAESDDEKDKHKNVQQVEAKAVGRW